LVGDIIKNEEDYSWLIDLCYQKRTSFPHLSFVRLSQEREIEIHNNREMSEWNYPPDLALAFYEANIKLEVITLNY
jgi:hypothetical protein